MSYLDTPKNNLGAHMQVEELSVGPQQTFYSSLESSWKELFFCFFLAINQVQGGEG